MFGGSSNIIIQGGTFIIGSNIDSADLEEFGVNISQNSANESNHKRGIDSAWTFLNEVGANTISTAASFVGLSSNITHVQSRWIAVDELPGGTSDSPEIKGSSRIEEMEGAEDIAANDDDGPVHRTYQSDNCHVYDLPGGASDGPESNQIEEIEGAEDIPANDDDSPTRRIYQSDNCHVYDLPGGASDGPESSQIEKIEGAEDIPANDDDDHSPIHRTYHFDNCHVYINSFNTRGVKVNNSGNYAPRVTHNGTAPNEGPSSFSKLSQPDLSNRLSTRSELKEDSSSYASDDSPSVPPVGIDVPLSTFEQKQPTRDIPPASVDANLKLMQSNPATTTLPASGPESQSNPVNAFLPLHMRLQPNFLSIIQLEPFPDDAPNNNMANDRNNLPSSTNLHPHHNPATHNSPRHRPDTNSKSLEHHLDSALEILIQTSGILADGVTPRAHNTLKAINALIPMETPTYPPPFKSVRKRKVVKWLQIIPRSLKVIYSTSAKRSAENMVEK